MKNKNHIYVLGTHTSHDGSACLLKNGKISVAIEKERLTRLKHDGGNDDAAIQYCLDAEGITIDDVDLVVQNSNFDMFEQPSIGIGKRIVENAKRIVTISHHLAHAYSAIGTSPFEETAALTIDGCGNCFADCIDTKGALIHEPPQNRDLAQLYFEKDSYYQWKNNKLETIYKDFSSWRPIQDFYMYPPTTAHSIGGAYAAVSKYVFRDLSDVGKLMGLAPFGKPGVYDFEMFDLTDGRVFYNYDWMGQFTKPALNYEMFKSDFQYYADIAYWCQKELERALVYIANSRYDLSPNKNLAFSGGVALNAVANKVLLSDTKYENVYFMPAAGDDGLAIGCAYYGWIEVLGNTIKPQKFSPYLGKTYSENEIEKAFESFDNISVRSDQNYIDIVAEEISKGKVVGWFQKGSEFGPRALGHRSIIGDPRRKEMQDFINGSIKFREDFRPFAPSVPLDEVETYFDHPYESPYMILVSNVISEWREKIPAVVHKNNSARVQTVTKEMSPEYYELLQAFKKHTEIPILVNTSFNKKGQPIVETPTEAIQLFLNTALDILVIGDWIVEKKVNEKIPDMKDVNIILNKVFAQPSSNGVTHKKYQSKMNLIVTDIERTIGIYSTDDSDIPQTKEEGFENPETTIRLDRETFMKIYHQPEEMITSFSEGKIEYINNTEKEIDEQAIWKDGQRFMGILNNTKG